MEQPQTSPVFDMTASRIVGFEYIPKKLIRPTNNQPREWFDPAELRRLRGSLGIVGQVEVSSVKAINDPDDPDHKYELINGERRWRSKNEDDLIPCIIREVGNDDDHFLISVIANFGSVKHSPMEIAKAIERVRRRPEMQTIHKVKQMEIISQMFGWTPEWTYQYLGLLTLDPEVQDLMDQSRPEDERLGVSAAATLFGIEDKALQRRAAKEIISKRMKVSRARAYVRKLLLTRGIMPENRRGRKPSDDYSMLTSFITRLNEGADMLLDLTRKRFAEIFQRRSEADRKRIIDEIETCIEQLVTIRNSISGVEESDTSVATKA